MKQPSIAKVLLASSLTLAFASALVTPAAHAELVSEDVQADEITPEANGLQEEMVILKKAPAKKVVVREAALPSEPVAALQPVAVQAPVAVPAASAQAQATATATAAAPAARPSVGSSLDQGVANKMDDVRNQFENALLRTLDRIKITVDDGAPAAATATATAQATAVAAPAPAPAAPATTIVNDSVIQATAAPANYMTVESAPLVEDDEEGSTSVARAEDREDESFVSRIRVSPVVGVTSIGSSNSYYEIKSNVTLGINLEAEVAENFAAYLGYSYAKYDIGLVGYSGYGGGYGYNPLQYNQNLFELGGRFYLMPADSKFRVFLGAGVGLTKGYINYGSQNQYSYNYGYGITDYEVSQWLGLLETGAELKVARNVAVGANFKYATILSARENDRLRNGAFFGGNAGLTQEQIYAGNSIANESFYSILGTVKVSF